MKTYCSFFLRFNHYLVIVTIYEENPLFKDYIAEVEDLVSERTAARKELKDLYRLTY